MHDSLNWVGLKNLFQFLLIREVPFYEKGTVCGISMTGLKIIKDDGLTVLVKEFPDHMASDVSRPARDKNV
jgi:hypothetical protein